MTAIEKQTLEDELRFGLALKSLRPLDLLSIRDDLRLQLQSYRDSTDLVLKTYPSKTGIHLAFDFFDSNLINGIAMMRSAMNQEFRFATISAGAVLYFHEFFFYLMSRVDVLPSIGTVTLEKNLPFRFSPLREYPPVRPLKQRGLVRSATPVCPVRRAFAQIMALAASRFLIWHEIGHCVNGHVAQDLFHLDEIDLPVKHDIGRVLLNHTFEMDADAHATNQIFNRVIIPELKGKTTFRWSKEFNEYPASKQIYPTLIALNILFRLLARPEALAMNQEGLLAGTHPHPAVRSYFVHVTAVELGMNRGFDNEGWVSRLALKSAMDASNILQRTTGVVEPLRMLCFDDFSPHAGLTRVGKYMNELLDCWHKIKPELQAFALIPLALSKYERLALSRKN